MSVDSTAKPTVSPTKDPRIIQRESLIALYDATDGDNWLHNNGWSQRSPDECTWDKVTCTGGIVTELNLDNNNLEGTIPSNIASLSQLGKKLDV